MADGGPSPEEMGLTPEEMGVNTQETEVRKNPLNELDQTLARLDQLITSNTSLDPTEQGARKRIIEEARVNLRHRQRSPLADVDSSWGRRVATLYGSDDFLRQAMAELGIQDVDQAFELWKNDPGFSRRINRDEKLPVLATGLPGVSVTLDLTTGSGIQRGIQRVIAVDMDSPTIRQIKKEPKLALITRGTFTPDSLKLADSYGGGPRLGTARSR